LKFTSCISKLHLNIALIVHFLQNKLHDENGSFILNVSSISCVDLSIKIRLSSCFISEVPNVKIHKIIILLFRIHSHIVEGTQTKCHVLRWWFLFQEVTVHFQHNPIWYWGAFFRATGCLSTTYTHTISQRHLAGFRASPIFGSIYWAGGQTKKFSLLVTISWPVPSTNTPYTFSEKWKRCEKLTFHRMSRLKKAKICIYFIFSMPTCLMFRHKDMSLHPTFGERNILSKPTYGVRKLQRNFSLSLSTIVIYQMAELWRSSLLWPEFRKYNLTTPQKTYPQAGLHSAT